MGGEKDPFEPKKIKDIVTDALALCSERLKNHGVKLKLRQIPDQLNIECRSQQISQVILNLILNAKQALTLIPDDKWIMIEAKDIGSEVIITITDNGVGIAEDVRPKILEPFFTTKQIGDGPGLGLSISKGIIEDHGGRLYLDETQEYTTFVIQIPKTQKRKNLVA